MPFVEDRYLVRAPVDRVSEFHFDPRALPRLTPPPVFVQVHRADPLGEQSISEFTLWFGPLPIRWRALHSQVSRASGFMDRQETGPFVFWQHTHAWRPLDSQQSEMTERIEYRYQPGPAGWLSRLLFFPLSLRFMLAYRRRVIRAACEAPLSTTPHPNRV